ncbi:PQQ-binding-like beta-propeller repeat protein [Botrimarina sp.]|uniref:outer membrane protein assembly factor BamB family protein n=1 Tax=Botrimarina sp. TaxID=2795802 RepID=UPI0032EE7D69
MTDREVESRLELVLDLLSNQRYGEAAPLVERLAGKKADTVDAAGASLEQRLVDAIAAAPREGRSVVLTVLQGQYDQRLKSASGVTQLQQIVADWPPELFGDAALLTLAANEAASGAPQRSAQIYRVAREARVAAGDAAPSWLRLREAANWRRAGRDDLASAAASGLREIAEPLRAPSPPRPPSAPPSGWLSWLCEFASDQNGRSGGGPSGGFQNAPVAANDTGVYVVREDSLLAYDAASGRLNWAAEVAQRGTSQRGRRESTPVGSIACDDQFVYAVAASPERRIATPDTLRSSIESHWRRRSDTAETPNRLVALDAAAGGKLRWALDGADADSPVSGAAFLGPPKPAETRLYALTSRDQTVSLVEVAADTGEVRWTQPLVRFERAAPARVAEIPAIPVVGERLIYCPTARGAVAAVDPVRRRLAWIHYLPVPAEAQDGRPQRGWQGLNAGDLRAWENDEVAWRHSAVIENGDRLIVATPAAPTIEALDPATGESIWAVSRDEGLSIAGVVDDSVVVIESGAISSWAVSDGRELWSVSLDGDRPVGHGAVVGDRVIVPTRSGRFAVVCAGETESARLEWVSTDTNPLVAPVQLGDLIVSAGGLFSCSDRAVGRWACDADRAPTREAASLSYWQGRYEAAPDDPQAIARYAAALLESADAGRIAPVEAASELERLEAGPRADAFAAALRLTAEGADPSTLLATARRLSNSPAADCVLRRSGGLELRAARLAEGVLSRREPEPEPAEPPERGASITWSTHHVRSQLAVGTPEPILTRSSRRRHSGRRFQHQTFEPAIREPSPTDPTDLQLITRGNQTVVVATNRFGEGVFAEALPSGPPDRRSNRPPDPGEPNHCLWRGRLAVRLEDGYAVYRLNPAEGSLAGGRAGLLWTSRSASRADWPDPLDDTPAVESPMAIGPWGVVSISDRSLACRDLESGRLAWRRPLAGRANATRVLAVNDRLIVCDGENPALRLAAWTGEPSGAEGRFPAPDSWVCQAGDALLTQSKARESRRFSIWPLADENEPKLWERSFPADSVAALCGGDLLLVLDPDCRLTAIDIARGEERFETRLPAFDDSPVRDLRARPLGERILVEVDRGTAMLDQARGAAPLGPEPLLTGELHCLDRKSGEPAWVSPAIIQRMAVLQTAIADPPVLLLARGAASASGESDDTPELVLAALDARTGATLMRRSGLPADQPIEAPPAWAVLERGDTERVVARVGRVALRLETTDRPAPPRPPMDARVEDPDAQRRPDLEDLEQGVDRLFQWIEEAEQ